MKKGVENSSQNKTKEDVSMLKHLIESVDDSEKMLEKFYKNHDPDNFNKTKKFILNVHNKISEILS